jgi:large subunit ribosomal protein L12
MEYVYSALLLHSAGKPVEEDAITEILEAADVEVDEARVKALVASLDGVDIDDALESAAAAPAAAPAAGGGGGAAAETAEPDEGGEEAAEEAEEEEEPGDDVDEEAGEEGLGQLFG